MSDKIQKKVQGIFDLSDDKNEKKVRGILERLEIVETVVSIIEGVGRIKKG